jgi:hypothetical protein
LTDRYWKLLHKHHLIHTAAEEEHKRFMTAPLAMTPDTAFATAINSHFSACLQACPYTKDMTAEFIQAGQLRLALFFASNEGKFRIHQRYLSLDNTVAELGLPQTVEDMDIKEHVLRQLMTEALYQLPLESFRASASNAQTLKTPEDIRDIQIRLAEQRLIESRRLQESNGNGAAKRLAHGDSSVKKESDAPDAFGQQNSCIRA